MKQYLVIVVALTLITSTQCGLIDGFFGAVKDTTNAIKEDIDGAVRYGKNMVFGDNKHSNNTETPERHETNLGIVDRVSLKIHDIATGVREHVRGVLSVVDRDEKGNSFFDRMLNKMKDHVSKVKGFFVGYNTNQMNNNQSVHNQHENHLLLTEKLRQFVFRNNSSSKHGLQKTLQNLRDAVEAMRLNMTKHKDTEGVTDGAGLIDIRMATDDIDNNLNKNNRLNDVKAIQDKIDLEIKKGKKTLDDLKRDSNKLLEDQRINVRNDYSRLIDHGNNYKNDMIDSANRIESRLGNAVEDANTRFTNAYSAVDKQSDLNI